MKTILRSSLAVFGLALFGMIALVACEDKDPKENSEIIGEVLASSYCNCESNWFPHTQTPAPEEGVGSPFDTTSTTNCMFQQWAWQKFLWLTKPQSNGNPLFLDSLTQVTNTMDTIVPQPGASIVLTSADLHQAAFDAILLTNSNFTSNPADSVYYSIHVNPTMQNAAYSFREGYRNGSISPSNTETFPIGSLEMKLSWVSTASMPASEVANYFITTAAIQQSNGDYENTEMALLGVHVVGVVINHPEFIWATFTHDDMVPIFNSGTDSVSSSDETLFFTAGSTTSFDGIQYDAGAGKAKAPNQVYELFEYGVPRTTGDAFIQTSQKEPENFNNIDNLNNCAMSSLTDVWANYFYDGAIWINTDGLDAQQQADTLVSIASNLHDVTPGSIARGSTNNANVTMETFFQTLKSHPSDIKADNLLNCFTCHNAKQASDSISPLYLSHIFESYLLLESAEDAEQVNAIKHKRFMAELESMNQD